MAGSATFTIVRSSPTMNRLRQQMASTRYRRRRLSSGSAPPPGRLVRLLQLTLACGSGLPVSRRISAPLATADSADDEPYPDSDENQVSDHLAGDHEPRRLGLGGDVAEADRAEHGDGEVQRVG